MSTSPHRRVFLLTLAATSAGLGGPAKAQAMVDEKNAQAAALGYVADAKRVDTKKFPKFSANQKCTNCALFKGGANDKSGACSLFPGKLVAGPGWCSAWVLKAA